MDGRMVFWITIYSFAIYIKVSQEQHRGCLELPLVGKERNLSIPDSSYTASSYFTSTDYGGDTDDRYMPHNAKLYGTHGWAPEAKTNPNDYLQIDLCTSRVITAVATQGNGFADEWVTQYKINYTNNLSNWTSYVGNDNKFKIFIGNSDTDSVVRHNLSKAITARYIRFVPVTYKTDKTMRVNVYVSGQWQELPSLHVRSLEKSIVLNWTITLCSIAKPITGFRVKVGNAKDKLLSNKNRSYTWTNLTPYTEYNVSVRAEIRNGCGAWIQAKKIKTLIAVPEVAPTLVSGQSISSKAIRLRWKINRDKINGPLKGYRITYTSQEGIRNTKTIDVGVDTTYTLKSLLKYTNYKITIAVNNTKYIGPQSNERKVRTREDVPEVAPTSVCAQPISSKAIFLRWQIKRSRTNLNMINGPLKGYRITYQPQGGKNETIDVGDVTTYNLTSLLKYTYYRIAIQVSNTNYFGPPSKEQRVRTMEDAPSAPQDVRGTLTPARDLQRPRVVITWNRPLDLNGIIRNYTIVYYFNNASNKVIDTINAGTTSSFKYDVTIISSGTFSYYISASTIKEGPYAVGENILITEYRCPERSLVGKNRLPIPRSSYKASSQYNDSYASFNANLHGSRGWAPRSNDNPDDYLQIDLGSTPRVITAVATQGSGNTKEWVTTYKLYFKSQYLLSTYGGGTEFRGNTDSSSVVRHDLEYPTPARYIKFVPTAYHGHKTMRVDVYVSFQEAPRVSLVEVHKTAIHVRWTVKSCSPTHHIKGYIVQLAGRTHEVLNSSSLEAKYTVNNLKPYTEYSISVRAIKQVGYGMWSNITTRTAIADPEAFPVDIKVEAKHLRSITIIWKLEKADLIHGPFKGYKITYTPKGGKPKTTDVLRRVVKEYTTYTLKSLLRYTTYSVSIAVMNENYTGPARSARDIRTLEDKPETSPAITGIEARSSDSILLKWKKVDHKNINGVFKAYRITYTPQGGRTNSLDVGDVAIYTLTSLLKYTTYTVTIAVMNEKFVGPSSTALSIRTLEDAPSAPVNVTGTLIPPQDFFGPRVNITWDRPRDPNGIIRKYTIIHYYKEDTSNKERVIINRTSDLQYTLNVTKNRVLSFKISATTIKEGPYQSGNIAIPSDRKGTSKSNIQDQGSPKNGMVAGIVVGIILIFLFLVLAFSIWKRKRIHSERYEAAEPLPLELVDDSFSSATVNSIFVNATQEAAPVLASSALITETERHRVSTRFSSRPASVKSVKRQIHFPAPDINKLKRDFKGVPVEPMFDCTEGTKSANKVKNRYKNIIAYDHSLVTLEWVYGDAESFYINANYIHGYDGTPEVYIATQGPLDNTLDDFWRMIWEQKVSSIVMLTNLRELGKKKCYQYWPDNCDQYFEITVTNHKTEVFADFTIRTFFLSKADSPNRRVRQFHFTAWPDKGVPDHATAVLSFRRKVLALSSDDDSSPTVVHCSAGVGRTGTYIMIDAMLRQAQEQQHVDILDYLKTIRNDRPYMVQTVEQYIFVNMAIYDALTCGNTEVTVQNLLYAIQQLSIMDKRHRLTGYALEFQRLEEVTSEDTQSGNFDVGLSRKNAKKNRYPDIIAANSNRVILSTDDETDIGDYINSSVIEAYQERKGDYINASFVDTYREHNAFIMTQAPMENTIADFWRMVMDYKIGTVVMLNNLEEKCEAFPQYWPLHESKTYEGTNVQLVATKHLPGNILLRILEVSKRRKQHTVHHFQHLTWENRRVPTNAQSVLKLLHEVQKSQQKSGNSPIVIQCSNGVGRSGTFCAIASCLERVKQEQVLDVFQTIKSIRVNRPGAVETLSQYTFCYNIIQKYLDSFRDYANFGDI